jgi:uncharacterized SAM-binding protein YcdF (DUF218 family)
VGTFLALGVVFLVAVLAVTGARVWYVGRQDSHPHSDVILVLGAAQFDGRPSATLRARLDHAKALFDAGVAARIVTVGGKQPADRFTEAQAGVAYLKDRGVPAADLFHVDEGSDTLLSLRAADGLLRSHGWRRVVLVTDPPHSLRSRTMARDLGLLASTSPTRTGPGNAGGLAEGRYVARETLGYLFYLAFSRP